MSLTDSKQAYILIIDDQPVNIVLLEDILAEAGYTNICSSTDPRKAQALFEHINPDIMLLDLHMPFLNGFEVMGIISQLKAPTAWFPILVLTADVDPETKRAALKSGATDFLTKPIDPIEVVLRVENLLQTRLLHLRLDDIAQLLAEKLCRTSTALESAHIEMLRRLALAAEYKDDTTGLHTRRVGELSAKLGRAIGLPDYDVGLLGLAAPLHDVGKIGIPDNLLLKPSKLTHSEFETMRTHTTIGGKILGGIEYPLLKQAATIALYHHERWDGAGYVGLKGEAIPLEARIVSIADVFDALTHNRPYRRAWPIGDALSEIKRQSGGHFDPQLVDVFLSAYPANNIPSPSLELRELQTALTEEPCHVHSDMQTKNDGKPECG